MKLFFRLLHLFIRQKLRLYSESGETYDVEFARFTIQNSPPNVKRWFEKGDDYYTETLAEKRP